MKINAMLLSFGILMTAASLYTMVQKGAPDFVFAGYFGKVDEMEQLLNKIQASLMSFGLAIALSILPLKKGKLKLLDSC